MFVVYFTMKSSIIVEGQLIKKINQNKWERNSIEFIKHSPGFCLISS